MFKNLLKERNIELIMKDDLDGSFFSNSEIIINKGFLENILKEKGIKRYFLAEEASVIEAQKIEGEVKEKKIIGFGGGKAIDIAKKVSFDLNLPLISIPTAPSHDGLVSKNCSLYQSEERKSIPTKYPDKLVIPLNLWRKCGDLRKAGLCDIFSNIIALEDISLAEAKGEKFKDLYKDLSWQAVEKAENYKDERELVEALILSGIAMEETSRYSSGSEHEVERILEKKLRGKFLHGQLVGAGSLISAKVYSFYFDQFPKLEFNPKTIFQKIKDLFQKKDLFDFARLPLKETKPDDLKEVSRERPERYNLWNFINSNDVNWLKIVEEILYD
ncbi:MAG: iron-containing alcohol dehydrogenase [Minisyncoccales bacterium]